MPQEEAEKVVETTSVEEVAEPQTSEISNETEVEVNEEKFEETTEDAKVEKEKQSKETNAKFAQERREKAQREKAEKEAKEARELELQRLRYDTIKETLNGKNPYTQQEIKDDYDIQEYLTMREMEQNGLDPIQDYSNYQKQLKRKEQEKNITAREKATKEEWIKNDRDDFYTKYPDVKLEELFKNEMFQKFADGKVGNVPMASIYETYQSFMEVIDKRVKENQAKVLAKKQASPGSLSTPDTDNSYFTEDQVRKMTREEVRRNYNKILESQKQWK